MNMARNTKLKIPEYYTTREASQLSGLPRTMLDYLVRSDLLVPSLSIGGPKRGRPRKYSFGDLVILRAISHLVEMGVSISRLKSALKQLFKTHEEITPGKIPGRYLVTDGTNVYFRKDNHSIESLNQGGQLTFSFILEVQTFRDQIIEVVQKPSFRKAS